jgi:hypothetical protein
MAVWVQLRTTKYITKQGRKVAHHAGDWVRVGKATAREWVADGTAIARDVNINKVEAPKGSAGIMMFGTKTCIEVGVECLTEGAWDLRWDLNLFLQASAPMSAALIPVGFELLETWECAVPMWDYRVLAQDGGDEEDRAYTKTVIRDLRVPLYDIRVIFLRRTDGGIALMDQYKQEGATQLGFLRAVYRVKPYILPLPVTWTGQWAPTKA